MPQKHKITQKMIKKLTPPAKGQRIIYDGAMDGFGVRITANGVVSFILNYYIDGRKRRYTIGRWSEEEWSADAALKEAGRLKAAIHNGEDPLAKPVKDGGLTVADLAKDYLERHALKNKRASSIRNDRQMLNGIITPKLGTLSMSEIGPREIEALHHSLKGTPYRANRVLSLLSKMFALAISWKWLKENPAKGIPRYPEDKRETWLKKDQVQNLCTALDNYPDQNAADAIRMMMFTGSREGEVLTADWQQFDLKRGIWTKPSHHTKQKKIEHVPLNDNALAVLKRLHAAKTGQYLFPGAHKKADKKDPKPRATIHRPWMQCCKAAGLATAVEIQGKRRKLTRWKPVLRIHDLRHTYASHLVSKGESLLFVGKLLGHTRAETTMRYSHVDDAALRKATNRFDEVLA